MVLEEILPEGLFSGGNIEAMAGKYIPNAEEDADSESATIQGNVRNDRKRRINKSIRKTKRRNKPWTKEDDWEAAPNTAENDLGNSGAALKGLLK